MQRKHFFIVEEQSDLVADMEILRMGCHAALKLTVFTV